MLSSHIYHSCKQGYAEIGLKLIDGQIYQVNKLSGKKVKLVDVVNTPDYKLRNYQYSDRFQWSTQKANLQVTFKIN